MNVSQFFAEVCGKKCKGQYRCRWCGTECTDTYNEFMWVETKPIKEYCKCPGNHYVCTGCYLYRRQRQTLFYMNGKYKDRQCARDHSWVLTPNGLNILPKPEPMLLDFLLNPPTRFALSLIDTLPNQIQLAQLNDFKEITADTPLTFTMNGRIMSYTVYELREALDHGQQGKEPGVRLLLSLVGELPKKAPQEKRDRGRPVASEDNTKNVKRIVSTSETTISNSGSRKK